MDPHLVRVMACRLFGAKPLPEPMLVYCQLESWKQLSVIFKEMHLKMSSVKMAAILSGGGGRLRCNIHTRGNVQNSTVTTNDIIGT